jgi:hypothetical protein
MVLHSNENHIKTKQIKFLHTESSLTWLESETKSEEKGGWYDPKSNSV